MTTYIGLLRAVNLGPHNRVAMRDLCQLLADVGMEEPRSLLQSGNVVFRSENSSPATLESMLEDAVARRLKVKTDFFVRTAKELNAVIAANPFPAEAESDPSHLLVVFLKEAVERAAVDALRKSITGREVVEAKGRHMYIVYPDGIGRSRLGSTAEAKKLNSRGTARNWNTVLKLAAMTEK
jgi:uncharacterized protein (DUF1697 family)